MPMDQPLRRVVIESPFAGHAPHWLPWPLRLAVEWLVELRHRAYLDLAIRDSIMVHGEAPYASHGLYVDALDDGLPMERTMGMQAGFRWGDVAEARVVYCDYGVSIGMQLGIQARPVGQPVVYRWLYPDRVRHRCPSCNEPAIPHRTTCGRTRCQP